MRFGLVLDNLILHPHLLNMLLPLKRRLQHLSVLLLLLGFELLPLHLRLLIPKQQHLLFLVLNILVLEQSCLNLGFFDFESFLGLVEVLLPLILNIFCFPLIFHLHPQLLILNFARLTLKPRHGLFAELELLFF